LFLAKTVLAQVLV